MFLDAFQKYFYLKNILNQYILVFYNDFDMLV
jgi:hypothetical protein